MRIEALIFDVFGTCVDWREGVAREVERAGLPVDGHAFADHWRGRYQPAMERIRSEGRPYVDLDVLHRENLAETLAAFDVSLPDPDPDAAADDLARAWEKLPPWPDVVPGLARLRERRLVAPCSNGSIALMANLARFADLRWDAVLGAGLARDYKPKPVVYLASCAALRFAPERVMMVAAHNDDLRAARAAGLRTAFVPRPREHGPEQTSDLAPEEAWDVVATDFADLAARLDEIVPAD